MAFKTDVRWDTTRLTNAVDSTFRPSVGTAVADAKANSPSHLAGATGKALSSTSGYLKPTGLGSVWEHGRRGGYDIPPSAEGFIGFNSASGGGTGVRRGTIKGGAKAKDPYVKPAADRWATVGYQTTARVSLASSGFGAKL